MPAHPKVFISYSWDDEAHKEWVKELATQLRADGVDARLDHWHTVPGDQLPQFMEREIRQNDYVIVVCTPKYKAKSDDRTGGVGYEGDIMTGEVLTTKNDRKFIPVLARGTWAESWVSGKRYIDLGDAVQYAEAYQDLLTTILGTRQKPPPLGPLPPGHKRPAADQMTASTRSEPQPMNFQLYERRLPIYEAAVRLVDHIVEKGTCTEEELNLFARNTGQARFLFNEEIESYLRKLSGEALYIIIGERKRKMLDPTCDEYRGSMAVGCDRLIWFAEQLTEVKSRFSPFLQISP
jgi:hypothetical protein